MKLVEEMLDRNLVPTRTTDDFLNGELQEDGESSSEKHLKALQCTGASELH